MHERSLYHGKIHGGNVLVRVSDGMETVHLGDFAFSNLCAEEARNRLVKYSQILCGKEKPSFHSENRIERQRPIDSCFCFLFVSNYFRFYFSAPEILRGELFSEHSDCWQLGLLIHFWLVSIDRLFVLWKIRKKIYVELVLVVLVDTRSKEQENKFIKRFFRLVLTSMRSIGKTYQRTVK